jgi:GTP-binding protein LepA
MFGAEIRFGVLLRNALYGRPMTPLKNIRNFSIVAHIDHGKSTLADRLIQLTGGLEAREMKEQVLDSMDIERERGITIKAQTVRLNYKAKDGEDYILNLIDTPAMSTSPMKSAAPWRPSKARCSSSTPPRASRRRPSPMSITRSTPTTRSSPSSTRSTSPPPISRASSGPDRGRHRHRRLRGGGDLAKTGLNIDSVLEAIVTRLPAPKGDIAAPLKALLVDSWYDTYLGVVVLVRVIDGELKRGQTHPHDGHRREVHRRPRRRHHPQAGDGRDARAGRDRHVITASIKEVADTRVGDTITEDRRPTARDAPGLQARRSRWCSAASSRSMLPTSRTCGRQWASCASTTPPSPSRWRPRPRSASASAAASSGLLHLEIIQERLEREFDLDLIATAPSGRLPPEDRPTATMKELHNPADIPRRGEDRRDRGAVDQAPPS